MKTLIGYIILMTLTCSCTKSPGSIKKERAVNAFDKIEVNGNVEIHYMQISEYHLEIEADAKDLQSITTSVKDSILFINAPETDHHRKEHKRVIIYLSSPGLKQVALSGAAHFNSTDLSAESFVLRASQGVDIRINRMYIKDNCKISISGGTDCIVKKLEADNLYLNCSEGSDITLRQLHTQNIVLHASGSSDVVLQGKTDRITINASGGTDISIENLSYNHFANHRNKHR